MHYLSRLASLGVITRLPTTRTMGTFIVRPIHVTMAFRASMQFDDFNSGGFFQLVVTLCEACRNSTVHVLAEQRYEIQACLVRELVFVL